MLRLSSTSSLVLLWVQQGCYQTKRAVDFLTQLNLEEGNVLYDRCNKIFQYSEVIKNRKFGVMHLIKKCMVEYRRDQQILIAGAGFDALGIELMELYPHVKVFEIDQDNMDIKSAMVAKMSNELDRRISFIEVDLLNILDVNKKLSTHGWDYLKPTLLVLEGISYYLPTKSIQEFVRVISPDLIIFEFLKQDKDISIQRLNIPQKVFGLISDFCGLAHINKLNRFQIENLFNNMYIEDGCSMKQLEKMRTGTNTFFPTENSGWIEVCLLRDTKQRIAYQIISADG